MNNCPKCGNPLQVGTESCPICGTNTSASAAPTPAPAPAPVVEPAPVAAPVAPAPAPVVEPAPVAEPVAPAPAPVVEPTPVAVEPTSVAPTVQSIEPTSVQSIPAATDEKIENNEKKNTTEAQPTTTPKKKSNKTPLIILLLVVVAAAAGMFLMTSTPKGNGGGAQTPQQNAIASSSVTSNGFKFNLQDGWMIQEDGNNVIITNTDSTVAIKLESVNSNFSKINNATIESYYKANQSFTDTTVEETKISGKDAYIVNTNSGDIPVQVYYINGGSSLTLGATIVYQSKDSKDKYIASVTEMIATISYSDDSLKAISTIEMYSTIFGTYKGVFDHVVTEDQNNTPQDNPVVEQAPIEKPTTQTPQEETPSTSTGEESTEVATS